jgi:hypothetical protein
MASTTDRVMKPSEWEQLGLALRREKALQTKWQPARGAGCARSSTASGGGRKISLDTPFYRTLPTASTTTGKLTMHDHDKRGHFYCLKQGDISIVR